MSEESVVESVVGPVDWSDEAGLEGLPPREREMMRRLRKWLAAKRWTPREAEAVLSGFDPKASETASVEGLALLPGAYRFYGLPEGSRDPDDLRALADGLDTQREAVRGLRLETAPPARVLEKALGVVEIPWLAAASADPVCKECLPVEGLMVSLRIDQTEDAGKPLSQREFASKGGRATADNNPVRKRFFHIVKSHWRNGNNVAARIDRILKESVDPPVETPDPTTIAKWLRELRSAHPEHAATMTKSKGGRPRKKTP